MRSIPISSLPSFPSAWLDILGTIRRFGFPEALIAGGALRDLALGVEPKDLDVFVADAFDHAGDTFRNFDMHPDWVREGVQVPCGYATNLRDVRSVISFRVRDFPLPVQFIELMTLRADFSPASVTARMDFNACRLAADLSHLWATPEALDDIAKRRVTLARPEDAKQAERSLRRADRWRERFEAAGVKIDTSAADALLEAA